MLVKFACKDGQDEYESKVYVTNASTGELQSVINIVKQKRPHSYSIGDVKEELERNYYFIVWVEGLNYKTGEKIKTFDDSKGIVYTSKMTEAMRIKPDKIPDMKRKLRALGVSEWVIESEDTFVKTKYAPKNTLWNFFYLGHY
jgi:hypothetical protein